MISVAVTGGIGSGKSTVCDVLRSMRVPVLSADDLSKQLANSVPGARKKIRALIGPEAYTPRGRLDRIYVAKKVFGGPRLLSQLESILHPLVFRHVQRWLSAHRRRGTKVAAVEAALVFESGLDAMVDLVIVVDAPKVVRARRIRTRDKTTLADAHRRMSSQMSDRERRARADVVIRNNGTRAALRRRSRFLIDVLRSMAA